MIDTEGLTPQAPDIRISKLVEDCLVTLARPGHPLEKRRPKAAAFAGADHIEVNSLPALALIDRALSAEQASCRIAARVSSILVGLLLALNSDALLTLPASLAAILARQFGLVRIHQPFAEIGLPLRLLWHSSYDRDECHEWVRGEIAALARAIESGA